MHRLPQKKQHILLLGSGGREHALLLALEKSAFVEKISYASPLPAADSVPNPAMAQKASYHALDITNPVQVLDFCHTYHIDFVVIGPEAPIVAGVSNMLADNQIPHFAPSMQAGQLESSKIFTKNLCQILGVPTARYVACDTSQVALEALRNFNYPVVIKADGLAAGKGVIISDTHSHAKQAINDMFAGSFGAAGHRIILEEFLTGEEASFFVLCDGENIIPLLSAQDHKRAFDGDQGANTGGMGAYAPTSLMTPALEQEAINTIIRPIVQKMKQDGMPYQGVLYAGLMIVSGNPYLIEFNTRFGDPECQVLLQLLKSDILPLLWGCYAGFPQDLNIQWHDEFCLTVVMAANGYPNTPDKGAIIALPSTLPQGVTIHHAGTILQNEQTIAYGGRVLNITARGENLQAAYDKAYATIAQINFPNSFYRRDIGHRGLS